MIVVTAPRSRIGRQLLPILAGSAEPLRIVAREPSRLPASIRARAEIIQSSHADHEVVDRAFSGADTVFWLVPPDPRAVTRGSGLRRLHAAGMPRAGQAEVPVSARKICPGTTWRGSCRGCSNGLCTTGRSRWRTTRQG